MLESQWVWYPGPLQGLSAPQLKHVAAVTVVVVVTGAMLVVVGVGMALSAMQVLSTALQIVSVAQGMTKQFPPKSHWRNMVGSEQCSW